MGVLDSILGQKRGELSQLRQTKWPPPPPLRPLNLARKSVEPLRILAEIKRRSPSAGPLNTALTVAERAAAYQRAGATMISVLCDEHFFGGSYEHLLQARSGCELPLLCKEFILDVCQLDAARAWGAEAALLIVRCLDDDTLARLIAAARERELLPLVEVATDTEALRALDAGAEVIGVNARDLDTLEMDTGRAERVLRNLPKHITKLHLSGVSSVDHITRIRSSGADGALIGEILMRQDDPEPLLRSLVAAAS